MRSRFRRVSLMVCLAGLSPALGGCPGTLKDPAEFENLGDGSAPAEDGPVAGDDGGTSPADGGCGAEVPSTIFTPICATSACHGASIHQSGLDLAAPVNVANLLDQPTFEDSDGGFLLIDPVNPLQSALYTKLTATPPFGLQMPYGMAPLSADQIQCVEDWIVLQVNAADGGGS
jgi:hypothetical protein